MLGCAPWEDWRAQVGEIGAKYSRGICEQRRRRFFVLQDWRKRELHELRDANNCGVLADGRRRVSYAKNATESHGWHIFQQYLRASISF